MRDYLARWPYSPFSSGPRQILLDKVRRPALGLSWSSAIPGMLFSERMCCLLSFPLSPELNQTVTVQPDGYINLQNGRSVHAQGLSVPELSDAIKTAYAGTLHNPIVNVDLKDFQKPFFTVSGQVGKPGQYELRADITVAEAIAVAEAWRPGEDADLPLPPHLGSVV